MFLFIFCVYYLDNMYRIPVALFIHVHYNLIIFLVNGSLELYQQLSHNIVTFTAYSHFLEEK